MTSLSARVAPVAFPAACLLLAGCTRGTGPAAPTGPTIVTVSRPIPKEITDYNEFTGWIAAPESVEIRARVWGYLEKINFTEGQKVKKGDVLYEIDPRTYKAALDQAQAKVRLDEAQLKYNDAEYRRNLTLRRSGSVSEEDLEKTLASRDTAQASVGADKADVESKMLDLAFTKVLAPVSGRVGRTMVTVGNLVQSGQNGGGTLLTTLVSVDPVWAYFDVDTDTLLLVQQLISEGKAVSVREHPLPVRIDVSGKGAFPFEGEANFVDNQVNQATGTLRLRATVPNRMEKLYPGQFVRVRIPIGVPHQALLITDQAVETSQGQKVVYKVVKNKDGKDEVELQPVTLGRPYNGRRVVLAGLSADDRVIVNGLQRVRPGSEVAAKEVEMPKSSGPAEAGAAPAAPPPAAPSKK